MFYSMFFVCGGFCKFEIKTQMKTYSSNWVRTAKSDNRTEALKALEKAKQLEAKKNEKH